MTEEIVHVQFRSTHLTSSASAQTVGKMKWTLEKIKVERERVLSALEDYKEPTKN